jgi:carboxylate-amine ligase
MTEKAEQILSLEEAQARAVSGTGPAYLPPFANSRMGSMGIELELMVLDRLTYDLLPAAPDILRLLDQRKKEWVATPEITTSMLEVATSILDGYDQAAAQVEEIRDAVRCAAFQVGAAISGGGAHPFQKWSEQRIYPRSATAPRQRSSATLPSCSRCSVCTCTSACPVPMKRSASPPG